MRLHSKLMAEFFGTFWLVLGGCGSAMLAATFGSADGINIGLVGVSLAFGLTVMTMAYAVGPISGGHFNPAVSVGLAMGGRFSWAELVPYIIAQVIGAVAAAAVLAFIVTGNGSEIGTLASNGFGEASPGKYSMVSVIVTEIVMTAAFLFIILGATDSNRAAGFAPIAIGLGLTLIHLISIPVSNTSVNPARSTGPALISMDGTAISQLWVFWAAPIIGGILGAIAYKLVSSGEIEE
ncbi:MAG: aquaporin Z [Granulosicoccus sp.]|nr:aquaporin Z [Granulosicoccus sp.]